MKSGFSTSASFLSDLSTVLKVTTGALLTSLTTTFLGGLLTEPGEAEGEAEEKSGFCKTDTTDSELPDTLAL